MTEFELIERFFKRRSRTAVLGNGDDCALVAPAPGNVFAITTDTLVAGRHFLPSITPERLGRRAVHVNLSDLAAMGAAPRYALLSLTLPEIDESWVAAFAAGLWAALDEFEVELVGGNTTRGPMAIALTALGDVPPGQALTRTGACPGDELWVSGPVGDAGWALTALLQDGDGAGELVITASPAQIDKYECPTARVALGLALRGVASSCIDISDGLLSEAQHLASASGVDIDIDIVAIPTGITDVDRSDVGQAAPVVNTVATGNERNRILRARLAQHCLLATGDTYELLFTAPSSRHDDVVRLLAAQDLAGACIGRVTTSANRPAVRVLDAQSRLMNIESKGWDHFA
jgi:thiamine-monophosphate kinase